MENKELEEDYKFILENYVQGSILERKFNCPENPMIKAVINLCTIDFYSHRERDELYDIIRDNIIDEYTFKIAESVLPEGEIDIPYKSYIPGLSKGNDYLISRFLNSITIKNSDLNKEYRSEIPDFLECLQAIPDDKLYMDYNYYDYHLHTLIILQEKYNKLKQELEQEKLNRQKDQEKYEKEIEELLKPGNKGALAAESRFKLISGSKNKEEIKGLDEA